MISITGHSEIVEGLINDYDLEPTSNQHPYSQLLFESVPDDWKRPDFAACDWYATPGFGSIGGLDLFLVATDPAAGKTIILYNWIF